MNISVPDHIRKLLSEYSLQIEEDSIQEEFKCIICRKIILDAYQSYCGCNYCRQCILDYLSEEDKYCQGGKKECKEELLQMEINVLRSALLNRQIFKLKVSCPNESCLSICELKEMNEHLRVCIKQPTECPYVNIGCTSGVSKDSIMDHLQKEGFIHSKLLIELIENMKNEIHGLKDRIDINKLEISYLKEDCRRKDILIEVEKNKTEELNEKFKDKEIENIEIRQIVVQLKDEIQKIKIMVGGEIFQRVDMFSVKKMSENWIFSEYFYSHCNGYKLRLMIYPRGCGAAKDTHLSVYFYICKGEYDDLLPWPCKHTVKISIINQCSKGEHLSVTYDHLSGDKEVFDKPINENNSVCGSYKFISHEDLQSIEGLLVNDSLTIKCTISAPN